MSKKTKLRDKIDGLLSKLTEVDAEIMEAQRRSGDIRRQIKRAIGALLDKDPNDIELGHWKCHESPTGACVYDQREDPALDDCLFCQAPDSRR